MSLVVATYNVRNGLGCDGRSSWPWRRHNLVTAIRDLEADVVGLQEVHGFQQRFLEARLPGYEWVGHGRSGRGAGERCPVLVRTDRCEVVDGATRWYGATPDVPGTALDGATFPRIRTVVRLRDRRRGRPVVVVNTHLDEHRTANRRRSVEQLLADVAPAGAAPVPTILLGDLNATDRDAQVFGPLRAAGFRSVLEGRETAGTAHRFTGRTDGPRIDHVLLSPSTWEVESAAVVVRHDLLPLPSDHWPVVARLGDEAE